jgi:cytochrome c oxidase assembly protein subunit 15
MSDAALAAVRWHLGLTALLVFAIVVVGGATRLTESGLSITEWNLVMGVLPPFSEAAWLAEFDRYKQIPQYQQMNRGMSLADFQVIYLWEWGHRLLGRVIGAVFLIGFLAFAAMRMLDRVITWKMLGIGALIGLQGAIGWWMVASGLVDRVTVAPYRLATHLTLACLIFASLVWLRRDLNPRVVPPPAVPARIAVTATALVLVIFVQIYLGGLVAGTRSGYAYQTWPLMDGAFVPAGLWIMEPWWKNLFESTVTTQFFHRLTAYGVLLLALLHAADARRHADAATARRAAILLGALIVQACIGIATLWSGMTLLVALAHQAWIVPVLALALWHRHALVRGDGAHAARA